MVTQQHQYYIGLISGTSVDAIDAVLLDMTNENFSLVSSYSHPFPVTIREKILDCADARQDRLDDVASLDTAMGELLAEAVGHLLKATTVDAKQVIAIGSHGQNVRHCPLGEQPFSVQIGDPAIIAARTGITTVADFRRRDIANGGEGAPLAPLLHRVLLGADQGRAVLNIGGMANISYLPADIDERVIGFDTGPGNVLLDMWCQQHCQQAFDHNGQWASGGHCQQRLLAQCLQDAYFQQPPPKSTGREYFHLDWLQQQLDVCGQVISAQDVQATLAMLTAKSVADAMAFLPTKPAELVVCGGGVHNDYLMGLLKQTLPDCQINSMLHYGVDPDSVEAMLFAWLAKQAIEKKAVDLCSITGARKPAILGGIYYA